MSARRVCRDCAAAEADGATFLTRPSGQVKRLVCTDCIRAAAHEAADKAVAVQTRASYRAAYRHRAARDQLDLVDLLVPPP
jgi:hypothetical protein